MLGFGDTKGLGCSSFKVCMWEISCTQGVGYSGCKSYQFNQYVTI